MKTIKYNTIKKGTMLWIHATANLIHAKKAEYKCILSGEKVTIIL